MTRLLLVLVAAASFSASAGGGIVAFPARIAVPDGFQPEGIATAAEQFYVGSIPTGAVYRGSLRSGSGRVLVPAREGRSAIGLKVDRGRIFVAGGQTGKAFVYDAKTGRDLAEYQLATGADPTFVNDVVVTKRVAWFTDSFRPVLYRLPLAANGRPGPPSGVKAIPLGGDIVYEQGFNVNGIAATANGKTLVIVQSVTGKLFTVVPKTGFTKEIALGGASAANGDGILLAGKTLYVVQNSDNRVAKFVLWPNLRTGRLVRSITSPQLDVPTTVARLGSRLYVVNARFGTAATASTEYWVTRLPG